MINMKGFQLLYGHLDARTQYILKTIGGGLPFVGGIIRSMDNITYMDDYLRNRGMSYSSVRYPNRTLGAQGVGASLNFVSDNIVRLYGADRGYVPARGYSSWAYA